MALNIIDLIKGQLGPALISQAATRLGESESAISKAISALLPAVVGGLSDNMDKTEVIDAITGEKSDSLLGDLLGSSSNNSLISPVLTAIFGDRLGVLTDSVSNFSGVTNTSASSLLDMVTGAALGSLGKFASDNNLDVSGITSLLNDQKGMISSLIPAGLSLSSLGLENLSHEIDTEKIRVTSFDEPKIEVSRGGNTHSSSPQDKSEKPNDGSVWKWLLPLLLLALAAWFLWNNYKKQPKDQSIMTTEQTDITDSATTGYNDSVTVKPTNEVIDIDLNGTKLKGYANGMEASMINFLKSDGYKNATDDAALKNTWYNFDNVNFKINSATELEPGSEQQIQNLATILKSYPDAKIKIGGYTDITGDAVKNKELSQKRAEFLRTKLGQLGVGTQITGADGYGSEFAKVPAEASNDERATDRKMAVRFVK